MHRAWKHVQLHRKRAATEIATLAAAPPAASTAPLLMLLLPLLLSRQTLEIQKLLTLQFLAFFSSVYYYGFFMHCPPFSRPTPGPLPLLLRRQRRHSKSSVEMSALLLLLLQRRRRRSRQKMSASYRSLFFYPLRFTFFFSVFLLATFFYAMWQRAVQEGAGMT